MDYLEERFKRRDIVTGLVSGERPSYFPKPAGLGASNPFPASHHNQRLVTSEPGTAGGLTYYHNGVPLRSQLQGGRRQRSLPTRKTRGQNWGRHANSAPSRKQRSQGQGHTSVAPLPSLPTINHGGVVTTNFAGFSTRDQEASHHKSSKFASNWAQVRVENHFEISASPNTSPRNAASTEDRTFFSPTSDRSDVRKQGRSPTKSRPKNGWILRVARDPEMAPTEKTRQRKKPNETKEIRFVTPADEDEAVRPSLPNDDDTNADTRGRYNSNPASQPKKKSKPTWNNRLAPAPPAKQPTVTAWRRYEAELTHAPEVTSAETVYKTYTGHPKPQRRQEFDEPESRPSTRGGGSREVSTERRVDGVEEEEGEEEEGSKDYVLTRNEAKMYIHLTNVYGSDAFRQQRKEWFLKKLTDVQIQELKERAEDKRRRQNRKEESQKRQQRQLARVRRKFERQQRHRFRTQYVTSRVLEYEKADRYAYGLPADSDDDVSSDDVSEGDDDAGGSGGGGGYRGGGVSDDTAGKSRIAEGTSGQGDKDGIGEAAKSAENNSTERESTDTNRDSNSTTAKGDHLKAVARLNGTKTKSEKTKKPGPSDSASRGLTTGHTEPSQQPPGAKNDNSANKTDTSHSLHDKDPNVASSVHGHAAGTKDANSTPDHASKTDPDKIATRQHASKTSKAIPPPAESSGSVTLNPEVPHAEEKVKPNPNPKPTATVAGQNSQPTDTQSRRTDAPPADGKGKSESTAKDSPGKTTGSEITPGRTAAKNGGEPRGKEDTRTKDTPSAVTPGNKDMTRNTAVNRGDDSSKPTALSKDQTTANKNAGPQGNFASHSQTNKAPPAQLKTSAQPNASQRTTGDQAANRKTESSTKNAQTKDKTSQDKTPVVVQTKDKTSQDRSSQNKTPVAVQMKDKTSQNKTPVIVQTKDKTPLDKTSQNKTSPDKTSPNKSPQDKTVNAQTKALAKGRKPDRKLNSMFDGNAGLARKPGPKMKMPKMEGIDTVVLPVTDGKGRTKMKKRQVDDVVKEAKGQLADNSTNSNKTGNKTQGGAELVRTVSVDTLDFTNDEEEEEEDVFERVRRKYNLQIDSDDDE